MTRFIIRSAKDLDLSSVKWQIVRSLIAAALLFTLIFSDLHLIIRPVEEGVPYWIQTFSFFYLFNKSFIWMKAVAIVLLLLVISGYFPRYTSILHWWVTVSFAVSCGVVDGGDQIASLVCLFISPILIIKNKKNGWVSESIGANTNIYVSIILLSFFWVLRFQVSMIYFQAATAKFSVTEWSNGTASFYWLLHPVHGAPVWLESFLRFLLTNPLIVVLVTWGALCLEVLLAMSLFMEQRFRRYLFFPAVLFHFSIVLIHGLSSFFLVMCASLMLLLLSFKNEELV